MPDYSKTIIYKIVCKDETVDYLYVGSTTNFTKRKYTHKNACNNETNNDYNQKKYVEMRNNGGWENFRMIEVEKYPCHDKREAEKREEELRLELRANMNSYKCYTTAEQEKEQMKESRKKYRDLNKDKYKQYRDLNKDKAKEYYEKNKDKITDKALEKFNCECGGTYTHCHKSQHNKTKKHLNFLESQNN